MEAGTLAPSESLGRGVPVEYKRVYLWHWPIRAMHWIAALCIVSLVVTGFYIGKPYFMTGGEPSDHFLMGRVRFVHFVSAGLLVATAIVRSYWLFVGNKYERWRALFPYHREDWSNLWLVLKKYFFVQPWKAPHYMGHNPLQQLAYTSIYGIALLQVLTGFHMYGLAEPGGFFAVAFGWVGPLLGGTQIARFLHHVLTWVWVIFLPIHFYLTIRADVLHHESRVTSIVSGGRYVRADIEFVDD
ncbi:MAG: Ni/Fe-hydrogenase, b-type cytochrome subunit [Gemmatimonadota bacterium]|nr:Ni/Fe-hydrogenase, b-type cytochrome subunit [Gemmatimonadota bacterium]